MICVPAQRRAGGGPSQIGTVTYVKQLIGAWAPLMPVFPAIRMASTEFRPRQPPQRHHAVTGRRSKRAGVDRVYGVEAGEPRS